jgi:predicted nucleotidyltransferase
VDGGGDRRELIGSLEGGLLDIHSPPLSDPATLMEERSDSPFEQLRAQYSGDWPALVSARKLTARKLVDLEPIQEFESDNTSVVIFGSFARGELTSGSDVDWSLLIDGPADPEHLRIVREVGRRLEDLQLQEPGTTDTFGTLVSSHELIQNIGGINDTNQNLTRRILLLLESHSVTNSIVRDRILRGILNRYLVSDASVSWYTRPDQVIPRFLLNDIVRFWRTMAVDYAAKRWEQADRKWALRNAKLRMSRKLLFVSGLLLCFSFELHPPDDREDVLSNSAMLSPRLADFLLQQTGLTPLDLLSRELLRVDRPELVMEIMNSYDAFLSLLADSSRREHLASLKFEAVGSDVVFEQVRRLSHSFQNGLTNLFFGDEALRDLTIKYGVF